MKRRAFGCLFLFFAAGLFVRSEGPQKLSLDNGMTVVFQQDKASAVTVLEIQIRGGQAAEGAAQAGLSFLATRLGIDIPDNTTARDFMVKALHYTLAARSDYSVIQLECLTVFFEDILDSFVKILSDPLFTGIRIDRIREYMDHQRRIQADDAGNVGHLAQLAAFFGDTGYGRSVYGTEKSLQGLKTKDIKDFYERYFVAGNMTLTAVSDLDKDRMMSILGRNFGKFQKSAAAPAIPSAAMSSSLPISGETQRIDKDVLQSFVSSAYPLPPVSRRGFALTSIVENTLGRGPGTRLWALRTEAKLAYNVAALATQMKDGGFIEAFLETDPGKEKEAGAALERILDDFREHGVTAEELDIAKIGLKAQFLRANETKASRASTLCTFEALGLGADFFAAFAREVDEIAPDEINNHIRVVFDPARAHRVVVGPKR
jgi:zinc protease